MSAVADDTEQKEIAVLETPEQKKAAVLIERLTEAGIDPDVQLRSFTPEEAEQRFWKSGFLATYNEHMSYVTGEYDATQFASRYAKEYPKDMTGLYLAEAWLNGADLSGCNISRSTISMEQLLSQRINWQDVDFTEVRVQEYHSNKILDVDTSRRAIKERMEFLGITSNKGLHHPLDDIKETGQFDDICIPFYKEMVAGAAIGYVLLTTLTIATSDDFNKVAPVQAGASPAITENTSENQQTIEETTNDHGLIIEP